MRGVKIDRLVAASALAGLLALAFEQPTLAGSTSPAAGDRLEPSPVHLRDTGLYANGSPAEVDPRNLPFSPQYPLWSDGATKRRWIQLPPGTSIDASRPNAWDFPPGTRVWKEFALGRPIETRLIERLADGSWRFATYVWNEEGTDAVLAPETGVRALPARGAPGGRYAVPSRADCLACHEGAAVPILGFGALQLSPDRDPLAPHAEPARPADVDLRSLVARGLLRNLAPELLRQPPRIAASSPTERAALGYLHGNCGHCHGRPGDSDASVPVDVTLAQDATDRADGRPNRVTRAVVGTPTRYRPRGAPGASHIVEPGKAEASVLVLRMRSRDPRVQMPPLGTAVPDAEGIALIERWINLESNNPKEVKP